MSFPDAPYSSAPYVQGPTSPAPTYAVGPYQQFGPPTGGLSPQPPKKKRNGLLIALWCVLGAGILVAFIALVAVVAPSTNKPTASTGSTGAETPAACAHGRLANGQCAEDTAAPPKTYPTPTAADFALAAKVTKKQCFGSAGCNVEFEINLAYAGPPLEPNSSWDVTFDLQGTEDSYTSTLHLTMDETGLHGTYEQDSDQLVQTKSSKTVLKPVVTSVTQA